MTEQLKTNIPNAGKLVSSLRHLDYDNLTSLSDIIDNSIDAKANYIWLDIVPDENVEIAKIIISDNGIGMPQDILDEALKLGSSVEKNASCDLGLYGMGLITASISMGTKLEVLSKTEKGNLFKSVQDLDLIYEKDEFVKTLDKAINQDVDLFNRLIMDRQKIEIERANIKKQKGEQLEQLKRSGTIVTIDNIDNSKYKKAKGLKDALLLHFGQVYRKFLKSNSIRIFVQDEEVKAIDPIYDFEPTILFEDEIKLEEGSIEITITELKDHGPVINKNKNINMPNQGFYVLRNNREILTGESFGLFSKHNDLNLLRIEFSYQGTLDKILSSNFSKNKICLDQSVKDKVNKICTPFIKQVRKKSRKITESVDDKKEDFSEIEKHITRKSHLLKWPHAEVEERDSRSKKNEKKTKNEIEKHGPRLNIIKRKKVEIDSKKVKFFKKRLNEQGPLYEVDKEREKVIIYWNEEHPFYQEFISKNSDNPDIFNPICLLIYALGTAHLISKVDSDSEQILENIRYDLGRNLAIAFK